VPIAPEASPTMKSACASSSNRECGAVRIAITFFHEVGNPAGTAARRYGAR
jgi:hypothetical protein